MDEIKEDAAELFIVGDLFDFWIEHKYTVPKGYYRLLSKISELVESDVKITYISGNHDFWRSNYFYDEFRINIDDTKIERIINDKRFFIHHGDGLAYKDTLYKVLKKILRNRVSQFLYGLIHPTIGIGLAKRTSSTSRLHTSKKDYSVQDGLREFGRKMINAGFDYVIMGHRHRPEILKEGNGVYINLGDWMFHFTYAVFDGENIQLKKFYNIKTREAVNEALN